MRGDSFSGSTALLFGSAFLPPLISRDCITFGSDFALGTYGHSVFKVHGFGYANSSSVESVSVAITFASLKVHLLRPVSRLSSVGLVMPMREHIFFFVLLGITNHSAALAVSLSILFTPS